MTLSRSILCLILGLLLMAGGAVHAQQSAEIPGLHILVEKSERRLSVLDAENHVIHSYRLGLGRNPKGAKAESGDGKTPEGLYTITGHNEKSDYFLSLKISYPNKDDMLRAKARGVSPGGDIFIHGQPNTKSWMWQKYGNDRDWTQGCITLSNGDMKEIWTLVPDGTPIEIRP